MFTIRRATLTVVLFLGGAATVRAEDDFSKVEVKATQVQGNVWMLQGQGGNIGVSVGSDGLLIVDDEFAPLADKIRAALKGIADGKLKFILNTHWHGDHTGSNSVFGPEAPIIAQTNVRKRLAEGSKVPGRERPPEGPAALPVITFDQSLSVHFNGEEIQVLHVPAGHTDGDSIIFFTGSNVVHMGDQFFNGSFPFVDIDSGGNVEGYIKNVRDVLAKLPKGAKIIAGHGPIGNAQDLEKFLVMLEKTTAIVRDARKAGKTLERTEAAGFPDEWKSWGEGFVNSKRWVDLVWRSLEPRAR